MRHWQMLGLFACLACGATVVRAASPTFAHDVAPLVFANCVSCHRPGEAAPFSLTSYADAKGHAKQIAAVTGDRLMPPWKAEPGWGHFTGERRLTDAQVKLLADWVAAGAPEGDAAQTPPVPTFPDGWKLGPPDLVLRMPAPITIPADGDHGRDIYRAVVMPLNLDADKYVTAVEFRPDNRRVVHHALFFLDATGAARGREEQTHDGQPGYVTFGGPGFLPTGSLGGWAPGATPEPLPDGWGRLLRKGSDLVMQFHFHPTGKVETEQAEIGLYYAKQQPTRIVAGGNAHNFRINIPANDANYVVTAKYTVPIDVDLIGLTPHAHLVCRDMKATATLPDGSVQKLIWIKDWDFNWQGQYRLADPLRLPAGTVVNMTYTYDNSADNVRNPNTPPKPVHFGEQTTDEMAFLFFEFSPVHPGDMAKLRRANQRRLPDAVTRFFGGGGGGGGNSAPPAKGP